MSILLRTELKKTHHQQRNDDQNRKRWTRLQSLHIFYELHWGLQTCHNKATSSCTVLAPCHYEEVMKVYSDYVLSLCLLYRHQTKTCPEQSVLHFCQRAWSPFIWLSDEIYTFKGSHNLVQGNIYIYTYIYIIFLKNKALKKKILHNTRQPRAWRERVESRPCGQSNHRKTTFVLYLSIYLLLTVGLVYCFMHR